ncbi:hypothetical protein MKW92_047030 [Papaver armeniacum]|nr:hypothetical protein MKW92_047030 [Papaver armeniacum]
MLENGQEVAVKKMLYEEADFSKEVKMLSCLEHSNIVKMIGYCNKGKDRIIVFEFMPLRSLNLHLHDLEPGKEPLDWKTRMKIAEGVARALEYLHDQNDPPVIYSGLKSTSILLDENYNPKLSDFGCARHGYGYIGPEYIMKEGTLTTESDVFGFGVVLLELISGEKPVKESIRGSGKNTLIFLPVTMLILQTRPLLEDSEKTREIADPLMKGQYPYRELVQALELAKMCVQEDPHKRPRIADVVTTLSNVVPQIYEEAQGTIEADQFTPLTM